MQRPEGTYCSDPDAKFTVSSASKEDGCGIQGYYTNEIHAHQMRRWCASRGHTSISVDRYDPKAPNQPGIHPLVKAMMRGYT